MKTIKPTDLRPGDIPAIHRPNGFLPKGIRFFMWLWSVIHYHKKPAWSHLRNHTMIIAAKGQRNTAEAIAKGFVLRNFMGHYADKLEHMVVFRLKDPLEPHEIKRLYAKAREMADSNIEYEVWNFACWIVYILSNGHWDIFPKDPEDKVFCFEVSAMLIEAARPGTFEKPYLVNTVDLQNDDRFEELYFEK